MYDKATSGSAGDWRVVSTDCSYLTFVMRFKYRIQDTIFLPVRPIVMFLRSTIKNVEQVITSFHTSYEKLYLGTLKKEK